MMLPDPTRTIPPAGAVSDISSESTEEAVQADPSLTSSPSTRKKRITESAFWQKWYPTFKNILPIYIPIHLAIIAISCMAFLFTIHDLSGTVYPLATLWKQWNQWDTKYYVTIATQGYVNRQTMAFFPLYPLLLRGVMFATKSPILAGMVVSNLAELVMFTVLYRLVEEDFGKERAFYTVLFFGVFPSAFFFSGVYTESLFLCLSILCFYNLRHGRWFLAGLSACFAGLTRPDGVYLLLPFCYEYFSRIWVREQLELRTLFTRGQFVKLIKGIRWNILAGLLFLGGVVIFMAYGYDHFRDLLAFVHAHDYWSRLKTIPGYGILKSAWAMLHHGAVSFATMRNGLDLSTNLFVMVMIILIFVGPWRFSPRLWGYGLYSVVLFLYFQAVPVAGLFPLESIERFLLEIFPAFILLSALSKNLTFRLSYLMVSGAMLFWMLTQFLDGHWIT